MLPQYNKRPSWFPGFKTLDRYIIGKFVGTYLFAIAMIIVVVVVFDYVEKIDDFTQMHAPVSAIIFDYYFKFVPFFINQFSALFTFIAVIFFTSKLAYQTENVAILPRRTLYYGTLAYDEPLAYPLYTERLCGIRAEVYRPSCS